MSKGCGCQSGIFKWLKPPYAKKFDLPCVIHDDAYDIGGNERDRKAADKILFYRIIELVNREYPTPWKTTWFTLIALLYYVSVRAFGKFYFNYTKTWQEKNTN